MRAAMVGPAVFILIAACLPAQEETSALDRARTALGERRYDECLGILAEAPDVPERHRVEGEARFFKGEMQDAVRAFRRYLSLAADAAEAPRARFRLADCLARLGQFEEAVQLTRQGLAQVSNPARRVSLARMLMKRAEEAAHPKKTSGRKPDPSQALRFYVEAKPFAEDDPVLSGEIQFALGRLSFQTGRTADALRTLAPLVGIELPPGLDGGSRSRNREALPEIDVDRPPEKPRLEAPVLVIEATRLVGDALLKLNQPGRARDAYRSAFMKNPEGKEAAACLLGVARSYGLPQPAYRHALQKGAEALERLIKSFPDHESAPEAFDLLARAHRSFNRPKPALRYLGELVRRFPKSDLAPPAAREIARIHRSEKDYPKALEAYDQALAAFPTHRLWAEIRRERIDCEYECAADARRRGDRTRASRLFNAFLGEHPLDRRVPAILLALGQMAEKSSKPAEAAAYYTTLASKYPGTSEAGAALLARATIEEQAGDFKAARATLQSIPQNGGLGRLRKMEQKQLELETRNIDGAPTLHLTTRNLEKVELRLYRISAVDYFQKHLTLENVAKLDVPLIRPNHTWSVEVQGYQKYRKFSWPVEMPSEGAGAFVVSAVADDLRATTLVLRSPLRLVARMAGDRVDVLLGHGPDLTLAEGADIIVAGPDRVLLRGRTNGEGRFSGRIPADRRPAGAVAVIATRGEEVAWTKIAVPTTPTEKKGTGTLLWTDRTRYRGGETVRFWAVTGSTETKAFTVEIVGRENIRIRRFRLVADAGGVFAGAFLVPKIVDPGQWTLRVTKDKKVVATRTIEVAPTLHRLLLVDVCAERTRVPLGEEAVFRVSAADRWGHPAPHERLSYRITGDATEYPLATDEHGKACVRLPSDRYGLTDSVGLDVFQNGQWLAGTVVPVVWDGFRAKVEPARDTYLLGETIKATVSATTFDGARQARDLTVVARRVLEGGRSEEVCRVPVRTTARGEEVTVVLPIPGEGAFSLLLEGDEGMVPTGSALFVSGADDPKKIRIINGGRTVMRPGTTLSLRVHCRTDSVTAVLVAANHRDQRIERVRLNRGSNLIPIQIRHADLPWLRIRIGAAVGAEFHADEITVAVEDPLRVTVTATPPFSPPGREVTLRIRVTDGGDKPVRGSAVVLMVPERLLPLYRGFFQGVAESFLGETRVADSPLASSYPFTYRSGAERLSIFGERARQTPFFWSNWASVVDRNATVVEIAQPALVAAAVYQKDVFANFDQAQARFRGQRADWTVQQTEQQLAGQVVIPAAAAANRALGGRPGNVINPALLNQGPGQVFLARNEVAQILSASNDGAFSGLFQDVDRSRNGWNPANVMVCTAGRMVAIQEDLETRLRMLAGRYLQSAAALEAPRLFLVETDEDGQAVVTLPQPEGKWSVLTLISGHGRRFGEAACTLQGSWPVRARLVAPPFVRRGDRTFVDVLLGADKPSRESVRLAIDGGAGQEQSVDLTPDRLVRARFGLSAGEADRKLSGAIEVAGRRLSFTIPVVPDRIAPPRVVGLEKAESRASDAEPTLTALRRLLARTDGNLSRAAWIIARMAELRSVGRDAAQDWELETRLAWLLLSARSDGGWPFVTGENQSDPETSVLVAWAIGAAEKAGLAVPGVLKKKLIGYLRAQFSQARDEAAKTPLLLGLSRLESVQFAYANRLYRARTSLSSRDLAITLLLLRRQGDDSQMVRSLAALLATKAGPDGSFRVNGAVDPLSDARATTALVSMALFGLDAATSRQALAHLDSRPLCATREAAGLALEAVVRADMAGVRSDRRVVVDRNETVKPLVVKVYRRVEYLPLKVRGYTLRRGFNVVGHHLDRGVNTQRVGEGKRFRVTLSVRLPYAVAHAAIAEAIPAGARLVPGSVNPSVRIAANEGVLRFHLRSWDRNHKGDIWYHFAYELEGALPGEYGFRLPGVVIPGGVPCTVQSDRATDRITIAPTGEDDRKGYEMSSLEHEGLGRIYWSIGDYDRAYRHLSTALTGWRLRQDSLVRTAALLLDMDVRWKNHKAMVDHFEILKEGNPERSVPFRKILPIAEAYARIGEFERALQVQRGCLDGFFQVDFGLGHALLHAGDLDGFRSFVEPLLGLYPADETTRDGRYFLGQTLLDRARKAGPDKHARRDTLLDGAATAFRLAMEAGGGAKGTEASAFALAGTLLERERYDRAAALCSRAVALYSESHLKDGFEYVEAYSRFENGHYDEAEKICKRLAAGEYRNASGQLGPSANRFLALHMLGKIHHARGEIAAAVAAYRKVKDKFPDAAQALEYFEWRVLDLPELTELASNEDRVVRLTYKNVDRVQVRAYRVDLMTLYLRERSLNRIANINLAGIKPFFEGTYAVRPSTYRVDEVKIDICRKARDRGGPGEPISVPLPGAGAYLLVVRSGETEGMGMVLRTDLRMDVQTVAADGTLRATVYDRTSGAFASRVEVKFVGSQDKAFTTERTDLRGVAETTGLRGQPTVIARHGDQYAFYRSSVAVGVRPEPQRAAGRFKGKQADLRLDNIRKQLEQLNKSNRQRVQEGQKSRGGVQIKSLK